jgi:hypothetical protein
VGSASHAGEVPVAHRRQDAQATPAVPPNMPAEPTELAEEDEGMDLPDEGEAVRFAAHIKGCSLSAIRSL